MERSNAVDLSLFIFAKTIVQAWSVGLSFLHLGLEDLVLPEIFGVEAAFSASRMGNDRVILDFRQLA